MTPPSETLDARSNQTLQQGNCLPSVTHAVKDEVERAKTIECLDAQIQSTKIKLPDALAAGVKQNENLRDAAIAVRGEFIKSLIQVGEKNGYGDELATLKSLPGKLEIMTQKVAKRKAIFSAKDSLPLTAEKLSSFLKEINRKIDRGPYGDAHREAIRVSEILEGVVPEAQARLLEEKRDEYEAANAEFVASTVALRKAEKYIERANRKIESAKSQPELIKKREGEIAALLQAKPELAETLKGLKFQGTRPAKNKPFDPKALKLASDVLTVGRKKSSIKAAKLREVSNRQRGLKYMNQALGMLPEMKIDSPAQEKSAK